jgi:gamma-glutamyltranspeptidase / glutathione hydrolase
MISSSTARGAAASGHPETTAAAIDVLEAGGNAVDAAVAAALAATVCEPLLTGFGGGGLMTVRNGATGEIKALSFFSVFPGLDHGLEPRDFTALRVDYGPTHQTFHAGRGSAAVPGIAAGLEHVWERWGSLPRERLAQHAVHLAREGWTATKATQIVATMLSAITAISPRSDALFNPGGRPLHEGDRVQSDALAAALEDFGREGAAPFVSGRHADALLSAFGPPNGSLGPRDLGSLVPQELEPLSVRFGSATLHMPPLPCAGSALLAFGLRLLGRVPETGDPDDEAALLAAVMAATEQVRVGGFDQHLFDPGTVEGVLSDENLAFYEAAVRSAVQRRGPATSPIALPRTPGNTTHISVVDAEGNAVAYTSSLGESCGWMWPGLDLPMNNFLGEDDIHPLGFHLGPPGTGFRTMMTPSLLVDDDGGVLALGTGGSNRIRTAMLQVVHRLVARGSTLEEAVMAPRLHVEGDAVQVEDLGQGNRFLEAVAGGVRRLERFEDRHLYFGGVHCAARRGDGTLMAVGDPRRSGVGGVASGDVSPD